MRVIGEIADRGCEAAAVAGLEIMTEGNSGTVDVAVPITLSAPFMAMVTIDWTTLPAPGAPDFQAEAGVDYTAASGTVTFAPGETARTVAVSVHGDTDVEPDEYFVVSFRNPTNAIMGGFWGLGFGIIDNDD